MNSTEQIVFSGLHFAALQIQSLWNSASIPNRIDAENMSRFEPFLVSHGAVAPATVLVPKNRYAEAMELIDADPRSLPDRENWVCSRCGEENESQFDKCWNCQHDR